MHQAGESRRLNSGVVNWPHRAETGWLVGEGAPSSSGWNAIVLMHTYIQNAPPLKKFALGNFMLKFFKI